MKKSHIPLLIGDILMFIAVGFISYPNMVLQETMSTSSVILCCLLVLSGMCMVLAPFVFEHLENKQKISKDVKKTRENIDLIFENLSAHQLMIAESKEAFDELEEKLAFQLAKDTDLKFETFENALDELSDKLNIQILEISQKLDENQNNVANAIADSERNTLSLDELREKLNTYINTIDDLEARLGEIKNNELYAPTNEEIEKITGIDDISISLDDDTQSEDLSEETEQSSDVDIQPEQITEEVELVENVQTSTAELDEEIEEFEQPTQQQTDTTNNNKLSGLMSKALGNAMSTASSVEKLIAASVVAKEQLNEEEQNADEFVDLDFDDVEENQEQISSQQTIQQDLQNDIADLTFDTPEDNIETTINNQTLKEATHIPIDEMLFANVAVEKKRTLTKKDTVITLHTLSIGIGNKPYIRGNAEPLSKDKGIAMDYVEIGVWRVVLPSFDGEINYSIWKNDEEQIGEELYQITSGQKQEITI
ncbi:MAG: hypothetical protein E7035_06470 [Verrucomicrobiaceae bacterium]|nr:hypothetical protein [Verrucomicrobiaceae bacterium]